MCATIRLHVLPVRLYGDIVLQFVVAVQPSRSELHTKHCTRGLHQNAKAVSGRFQEGLVPGLSEECLHTGSDAHER